jgi:flagellar biosynthetic protein FliR
VLAAAADTISLPTVAAAHLVSYVLVMCRVGGLFLLAPIFSGRMIPAQAKLVVAGAVSFALAPLVAHPAAIPTGLDIVPVAMKEVLVGLAIALALGAVAAGVQAAASLLDMMIGFSFAALVDPLTQTQSAVIGQLYSLYSVLVFLLIGGDRLMIEGLSASYRLVPLETVPSFAQMAGLAAHDATLLFVIAFEVAAPAVVALALVDISLGLIARAVPQMNVFMVGLPAKILVGLGAIAASLPFVTTHLQDQLQQAVFDALGALKVR